MPVTFTLIMIHEGDRVTGMIREPNTMGERPDPWLFATVDGRFLEQDRALIFTKTSDDAEGVSHGVQYKGQVSPDSTMVEKGTWTVPGYLHGTFVMKRRAGSVR
jgi:hypothetical protein